MYQKYQQSKGGDPRSTFDNETMAQNNALNDESQFVGTYKGHEYQHIQHNLMTLPSGPGQGQPLASYCPKHQAEILQAENQNQIVSQSKVIIPRGIVNFKKEKVHSLSVARRSNNLIEYNEGSQDQNNLIFQSNSNPPR